MLYQLFDYCCYTMPLPIVCRRNNTPLMLNVAILISQMLCSHLAS